MTITSKEEFNLLQQRYQKGEPVTDEELHDAIAWIRSYRKTEIPAAAARKTAPKKAPANIDNLLNDLGFK